MNSKEINDKLNEIDRDINRNASEVKTAHNKLVNATRETQGRDLSELVNAESVLKARGEALAQIRAEHVQALDQARQDENSKEQKARNEKRAQLEKALASAAREAVKQVAALEKIVRGAIDGEHTELVRLMQSEKQLSANEQNHVTQNNQDFRYLYELYIYFERSRKLNDMIQGFEKAAQAVTH